MIITINREKFWNISSICYLVFWTIVNSSIIYWAISAWNGFILFGLAVFNLALCQFLPFWSSITRLNDYYSLRQRIPFYLKFNDHTSIKRGSLT